VLERGAIDGWDYILIGSYYNRHYSYINMVTLSSLLYAATLLQVQAARFDLDFWLIAPALALVVSAIAVWWMRLKIPLVRHIPSSHHKFWAAFSLGQSLWAVSAAYSVVARFSPGFGGIPVAQLASVAALGCWVAAIFLMYRYVPLQVRAGSLLDALVIITVGLVLLEHFYGVTRWTSDGENIVPALSLTWHSLYLYGALALGVILVLTRYMARMPLPASHSIAMTAMLLMLLCNGWIEKPEQTLPLLTLFGPANAAAYGQVFAIGRIVAAALSIAAIYIAVYRPQPHPRTRWLACSPWITAGGAGAMLLILALSTRATFLPTITGYLSYYSDLSEKIVFAGAVLVVLLALLRGGLAAMEAEWLRRERVQLASRNEEYVRLAISDPLTRLFNKGYFQYRLDVEWQGSQRHDQPLTLIALDLDNFKQVNDRYGHSTGDELLAQVGQVIRSTVRVTDCPCRVGGDEFIIIAPQTDPAGASVLAERLRVGIVRVLQRLGISPMVSVSCGISVYPDTAHSAIELLEQADAALYTAKQAGKNRVATWTPQPPSEAPAQPAHV
jgi:diguanylate cyclase (GGDEF)-like protein